MYVVSWAKLALFAACSLGCVATNRQHGVNAPTSSNSPVCLTIAREYNTKASCSVPPTTASCHVHNTIGGDYLLLQEPEATTAQWAMSGYNKQHSGSSPFLGPKNPRLLWSFTTADQILASPVIDSSGTVYIGSGDKYLYALNGTTGKPVWSFPVSGGFVSSPAITMFGTVVFSAGNSVYAVNRQTGKATWTYTNASVHVGSATPVIGGDGTIYFTGAGILALDGKSGKQKWVNSAFMGLASSLAIGNIGNAEVLYIGSTSLNCSTHAIAAATGKVLWSQETGNWGQGAQIYAPPAVGPNNRVYTNTYGIGVFALDARNGTVYWHHNDLGDLFSVPTVQNNTVFIGGPEPGLVAINATTGKEIWEVNFPTDMSLSPAIAADGCVYAGSNAGGPDVVFGVDPTGGVLFEYSVPAPVVASPAIGANGALYVGVQNGLVIALQDLPK